MKNKHLATNCFESTGLNYNRITEHLLAVLVPKWVGVKFVKPAFTSVRGLARERQSVLLRYS